MRRRLLLPVLLWLLPLATAAAPRVVVVAGGEAHREATEAAVEEALLEAGYAVVDAAHAAALRDARIGSLAEVDLPRDLVTALDADLVLFVDVLVEPVPIEMLAPAVSRRAHLTTKVGSTDDGRVVAAFDVQAQRHGYSAEQATRAALALAARDVVDRLKARLEAQHTAAIELQLGGLNDITAWSDVRARLQGMAGVTHVAPLVIDPRLTRVRVTFAGDAPRLAARLQGPDGPGLVVRQVAGRVIVAELSRARGVAAPLIAARFDGPGGGEAAQAVAIALANQAGLEMPVGSDPIRLPTDRARWPTALSKAGVAHSGALVLSGRAARRGGQLTLTAEVWQTDPPRMRAAHQRACTDDAMACADALASALAATLATRAIAAPDAPLVGAFDDVEALFPRRAGGYARGYAPGEVELRNRGAAPLDLGRPCVAWGDRVPSCTDPLGTLAPGAARTIALTVPASTLQGRDARHVALTVEVPYRDPDGRRRQWSGSHPVALHRSTAMDWRRPRTAAAFVTPRDPRIVRAARAALVTDARHPVHDAAALFEAMRSMGLRYAPDPVAVFGEAPLDDLDLPGDTLAGGAGDCDDLATLYAALASAVGLDAMLIVQPRHVLVAIDSGLSASSAEALALMPDAALIHDGTLWIPVEATALDRPFVDAWRAGAEAAAGGRRVVLRDAWADWPPAPGPVRTAATAPVEVSIEALTAVDAHIQRTLEAQLGRLDPNAISPRLRHLVALGRFDDAVRLARQQPESSSALTNQANLAWLAGRLDEAHRLYDRALTIEPTAAETRMNRALLAHRLGDRAAFDAQVFALLDGDRHDLVDALARAARGPAAGRRGSASPHPGPDICVLLTDALARRDVTRRTVERVCGRATVAERAAGGGMEAHLRWL